MPKYNYLFMFSNKTDCKLAKTKKSKKCNSYLFIIVKFIVFVFVSIYINKIFSGHLDAYPMALGNLGDLDEYMKISNCSEVTEDIKVKEEITMTRPNGTPRPDPAALYTQAIRSSRTHYEDRHVYPYTFQGGYYHRHKMYKEAFHAWACAGDVIRKLV